MTKYRCGHQLQTWNGNQRNCFSPAIAVILINQCQLHNQLEISDRSIVGYFTKWCSDKCCNLIGSSECFCFFLAMFLFYVQCVCLSRSQTAFPCMSLSPSEQEICTLFEQIWGYSSIKQRLRRRFQGLCVLPSACSWQDFTFSHQQWHFTSNNEMGRCQYHSV